MTRNNSQHETLHIYAPGDGALAFTVCDPDGKALPNKLTREECLKAMTADGVEGYALAMIGGQWRAFAPCLRLAPDALQLTSAPIGYRYTVARPGHPQKPFDFFWYDDENKAQVRNISTIGALTFWLLNEAACNQAQES